MLILIFLFYVIFRLLTGGKKRVKTGGTVAPPIHDVLVEDPICKVCVPMKQAVVLKNDGRTVYFCSLECREKFRATIRARKGD
jgi:YHS domain-containing protein